jgi:hypothetical protein
VAACHYEKAGSGAVCDSGRFSWISCFCVFMEQEALFPAETAGTALYMVSLFNNHYLK